MASTGQFNICCAGTLSVELHRPGILGLFARTVDADCMQISTSGMQIRTGGDFKVGQSLVIDLQAHDLRVEELRGIVKSVSAAEENYYYDIDFPQSTQKRDTLHGLRQLASLTSNEV
ncbi:MAG: hypothetical protein NXH85_18785 [Pseudomonadaceae bacterium]|nr:hypothetical protein [Pseudomonadaceae bacterium]